MPYIHPDDRPPLENRLSDLPEIKNKGELEFCIFYLMKKYMKNKEWRYSNLHDTVYAAQHCADDFRRRFLDKREDEAIDTNGDIL